MSTALPEATPAGDQVFAGRAALITGGGSGIGRAVAVALARRGAGVVVVGRRAHAVADTAALHPAIRAVTGDARHPADVDRAISVAVHDFGRLDMLVNNAAVVELTPLAHLDIDAAHRIWAINLVGPVLFARAALPQLSANTGTIVNVSSSFGHKPAPGISMYGASKAALEQLTRSWAVELADRGIRVNAVAPGPTDTEAMARSGMSHDEIEQVKRQERDRIPLGRRGEPDDIARWVVALADPASDWITGQVIDVDGGFTLT